MLKSVLVGALLTVASVGIHAAGTTWWIRRLMRIRDSSLKARRSFIAQLNLLCSTTLLLLGLHIAEVVTWACVYWLLPDLGELNTFEQATYFSTVTYASLGYGDVVIHGEWRLLSAIQAMTGLLIFGWSTALLFAVVERIWIVKEPN